MADVEFRQLRDGGDRLDVLVGETVAGVRLDAVLDCECGEVGDLLELDGDLIALGVRVFAGVEFDHRGAELQGGFELAPSMPLTIAIRPEKVQLTWDRPPSGPNVLEGVIGNEAYLGDRSHYYISVKDSDRRIAVAYQNMTRSLDNSDVRGRTVWLTLPIESAVLLPAEPRV